MPEITWYGIRRKDGNHLEAFCLPLQALKLYLPTLVHLPEGELSYLLWLNLLHVS